MTDIIVPTLGESISEAIVGRWLKSVGDAVVRDDILVELETDKVSVEVSASEAGVLHEILADDGASVEIGAVLGRINADGSASPSAPEPKKETKPAETLEAPPAMPAAPASAAPMSSDRPLSPSVRRIAAETGIDPTRIEGSGPKGRVTKADALAATHIGSALAGPAPVEAAESVPFPAPPAPEPVSNGVSRAIVPVASGTATDLGVREERVRMSRLRQTIAKRLKTAQNTAAILTTFNDVDLSEVIALRQKYREDFQKRHGVKLGFMGFFTHACIAALKEVRAVNAEIDGEEIIYKNYYNIAIAVGTDKGLVTPVIRDADRLSLAGIETEMARLGQMARDGQLSIDDLRGGSFTITNGGVYGSMLSTPILNPPQSAVLGMHRIEERPVALDGVVVIRPMMYLALSYDHRIIDGKDAVTFLVRVKQCLEDPERLLLDI